MIEKKTVLQISMEMHQDLRSALSCMDGCDKEDIKNSFLISKIAELQNRIDTIDEKLKKINEL